MTTDAFDADGVEIAYDDVGSGPPIVLVHGFASSRHGTWQDTGWYDALREDGRRVIALDCRGHGDSGKPQESAAYGRDTMAADVVRLLDHLGIDEADLMGYSMGGGLALRLLVARPERFNAVVAAGVGESLLGEGERGPEIAEALEADDLEAVRTQRGREFRIFAENRDNDLGALAAVQRARGPGPDADSLAEASLPTLVIAGDEDDLVGRPEPLAAAIPGAESVAVPGVDHLSTTDHPAFEAAVLDFLDREGL